MRHCSGSIPVTEFDALHAGTAAKRLADRHSTDRQGGHQGTRKVPLVERLLDDRAILPCLIKPRNAVTGGEDERDSAPAQQLRHRIDLFTRSVHSETAIWKLPSDANFSALITRLAVPATS